MSVHVILDEFRARTGWNDASSLDIVNDYIDHQQDEEAFMHHLLEAAADVPDDVNGYFALIEHQGWTDTTLLDLALDYIENQATPDAFRDHLSEHEDRESALTE